MKKKKTKKNKIRIYLLPQLEIDLLPRKLWQYATYGAYGIAYAWLFIQFHIERWEEK